MKKKKILLLGDDIRVISGVSLICKEIILNNIEKYDWVQLASQKNNPDDGHIVDVSESVNELTNVQDSYVRLYCSSGYGNQGIVRKILSHEEIDCILHITDPHRWSWLYRMEHEIRTKIPLCYYHVWDNYPIPFFNKQIYESCDFIGCISKLTYNCVNEITDIPSTKYIPHGIDENKFYKLDETVSQNCKNNLLAGDMCKFLVFCNNTNIPRKQLPLLIESFVEFCNRLEGDESKQVALMIHTNPTNPAGANLIKIVDELYSEYNILFSSTKVNDNTLNQMYNTADVTINIASNEGFGLSTMESLMSETPIIVNDTGGLGEQVDDDETWGLKIKPTIKNLIGSNSTPYIYEAICSVSDIADSLLKMYKKPFNERKKMGMVGREYACKNYSVKNMCNEIGNELEQIIEKFQPKDRYTIEKIEL